MPTFSIQVEMCQDAGRIIACITACVDESRFFQRQGTSLLPMTCRSCVKKGSSFFCALCCESVVGRLLHSAIHKEVFFGEIVVGTCYFSVAVVLVSGSSGPPVLRSGPLLAFRWSAGAPVLWSARLVVLQNVCNRIYSIQITIYLSTYIHIYIYIYIYICI